MTSICALLVLITAVSLPGTQYVLLFYLMLTRMYANSLLATLNVRDAIRANASSGAVMNSSFTHPQYSSHPAATHASDTIRLDDLKRQADVEHQDMTIKIDRRTEVGVY
ncbi:hypothetical protein PM082_002861 [Marasmius tenuissimus]|nr:hypothetical protein PM082_002861 [Marasmius tenuissimus]